MQVSIRDLRNHGGDVIDRVEAGEAVTVTRDGRPVAELRPLANRAASAEVLVKRWSRLPVFDSRKLRADIDNLLDSKI
jgi:prevent-host-death family protein